MSVRDRTFTMRGGFALDHVHLEPVGGVAGDMLLAAFLHLGADVRAVVNALASVDVPGLELGLQGLETGGQKAWRVRSIPPSPEPAFRHLDEIWDYLQRADVSARARTRAERVFRLLAEAEATVHGTSGDEAHLHEVGQLDSIMDVLGIAVALDSLGDPTLSSDPLPVGSGTVSTSHGVLDCPVPAVRQIAALARVPLVSVALEGETVTPTGIAVVAVSCERFGTRPDRAAVAVGVGAGSRVFVGRPNIVRAYGYQGDGGQAHQETAGE